MVKFYLAKRHHLYIELRLLFGSLNMSQSTLGLKVQPLFFLIWIELQSFLTTLFDKLSLPQFAEESSSSRLFVECISKVKDILNNLSIIYYLILSTFKQECHFSHNLMSKALFSTLVIISFEKNSIQFNSKLSIVKLQNCN